MENLIEDLKILSSDLSYKQTIAKHNIKPFLIFIAFLITFFIARTIVFIFPGANLIIFQYHIHHFYYGIILLTISNYISLISNNERLLRVCSIMLGIGLGLIADELGILLTCGTEGAICNLSAIYWSRLSFDIFIYVATIFLVWLYIPPVLKKIRKKD